MKVIKQVKFDEVLEYFDREHPIRPEGNFTTNNWARWLILSLQESWNGEWKLVELTPEEILGIWLPHHEGEPDLGGQTVLLRDNGATVKEAITRFSDLADYHVTNVACYKKIKYWSDKEIEPIFLSAIKPKHIKSNDIQSELYHVDGLHRLLAWGLKGSESSIQAFIAG